MERVKKSSQNAKDALIVLKIELDRPVGAQTGDLFGLVWGVEPDRSDRTGIRPGFLKGGTSSFWETTHPIHSSTSLQPSPFAVESVVLSGPLLLTSHESRPSPTPTALNHRVATTVLADSNAAQPPRRFSPSLLQCLTSSSVFAGFDN
ncbi:hypothetical protein PIB30_056087 [Stylosanthes scabra]|uniref:Uncharacterized protein n=1 Tax=Stylosanthes scabra TaxID=79078 RepID=A0ABU6TLE6_9FABA|nr:hypothetical protein [Stylosanthes scabra]